MQASLLGSILSNLLLILGMGFLLGGLRFREQVSSNFIDAIYADGQTINEFQLYNSTVTQMSACLLSLSVISLVLPVGPPQKDDSGLSCADLIQTAFHASFSDTRLADAQSLKISRGTSVVGFPRLYGPSEVPATGSC